MLRKMKQFVVAVLVGVLLSGVAHAFGEGYWAVTKSSDGVPISYKVAGKGTTTLIFVHGWSCDSRYWKEQVKHFSKKYRVVVMDLAGHGNSGFGRVEYTMQAFGADVAAVAAAAKADRVILIGHSMSGIIIGEASLLLPGKVIGLIGVDTLENVEMPVDQKQLDGYIAGLTKDFPGTAVPFVRSMLVKDTDPALAEWIVADMTAAPPAVGISAFKEMMGMYVRGDVAKLYDRVTVPVRCVNADLWPTDAAANRKHMKSFEVSILKGRGHFLMLEKPKEFNRLLAQAVKELDASR